MSLPLEERKKGKKRIKFESENQLVRLPNVPNHHFFPKNSPEISKILDWPKAPMDHLANPIKVDHLKHNVRMREMNKRVELLEAEIKRLGGEPVEKKPSRTSLLKDTSEYKMKNRRDQMESILSEVLVKLQTQFASLRDAWYESRKTEHSVRSKTFEESVPVFGLRSCFYAPRVGARQMMEMWAQPMTMPLIGERLTKLGLTPTNHPEMYKLYKTGKVKRCVNRMFWGKEVEVKKSKKEDVRDKALKGKKEQQQQKKKKGKVEEKQKKSLFFEALEADIKSKNQVVSASKAA